MAERNGPTDVEDEEQASHVDTLQDTLRDSLWSVGLVTSDPLREVGLRAILGDGTELNVILFATPEAWRMTDLEVLILDAASIGRLFDLLSEFCVSRPQLRLIVMGQETDLEHIERVIGAGAKGYLSHTATEAELKMALAVVRDGSVWAPRKVLARLLERTRPSQPVEVAEPKFTRRELQVLKLLAQGHPNRDIGVVLGVDESTIKAHVGRLMRKVGVANRTALTMHVLERKDSAVFTIE